MDNGKLQMMTTNNHGNVADLRHVFKRVYSQNGYYGDVLSICQLIMVIIV